MHFWDWLFSVGMESGLWLEFILLSAVQARGRVQIPEESMLCSLGLTAGGDGPMGEFGSA